MDWPDLNVDVAIELLNEMLKADPCAISQIIETRVDCVQTLADHPTVQVAKGLTGGHKVGLLGILNGLFGVDERGWGPIAAQYEKSNPDIVVGFTRADRKS